MTDEKPKPTVNYRSPIATQADAYAPHFPDLDYRDFLKPGEPEMQGALVKMSAEKVKRQRTAKGVSENGDPLKLQASGKARRKERARRDDLVRKAENLTNLFHRRTIDKKMLQAACEIRSLMLIATGGMQAMDWVRERVDGGKMSSDLIGGGAYAAESELRWMFQRAQMGDAAAEVVIRVAGLDETLKAVALDFDLREGRTADGKCSRDTQAFVTGCLREGLRASHRVLFPTNQSSDERAYRVLIRAWSAGTPTSDRPDLRGETKTKAWGG